MPVKVINTEFGHSMPPEQPHNITFYIPGWETAKGLRRGDQAVLSRLSSIYPRFSPWCEVRQLSNLIHNHLSLPTTHGTLLFTNPDTFLTAKQFSRSALRKDEHKVAPEDLLFRVVDIPLNNPSSSSPNDTTTTIIRLFVIAYPLAQAPGVVGVWQNYGIGISSRLAAALLPAVEAGRVQVLDFKATGADDVMPERLPEGRFLPEGEAHAGLRARIAELASPSSSSGGNVREVKVKEQDVFLYPTGIAAIYRLHRALMEARGGGQVVILGSIFHNTYHLFHESEGGCEHFGRCDGQSRVVERLALWLEGEKQAGRRVAYVFLEFPSNPILVSVDLKALRGVADKYDVPVVIDDTIGSFCNIDVLPVADVVVTSITKSLSGYANVMGGSVLISPFSRHFQTLKQTLTTQFRNEYFHTDAAKLLSNSQDYLARSAILNRNALTLATYLHTQASDSTSPVTAVLYPPFTETHDNYTAVMRPATPDFTPGYGCLLAVEFESLATAQAFYDHLSVFHGPHLGAHHTLAFPFNDAIWGVDPDAAAYAASYGARPEQVRVSVGLESEEDLIDTFKAALRFAADVKRQEQGESAV